MGSVVIVGAQDKEMLAQAVHQHRLARPDRARKRPPEMREISDRSRRASVKLARYVRAYSSVKQILLMR
jgi:hypothetical protein